MATLRELEQDLIALDEILMEVGGDVTDEDAEAAIEEWFAMNREGIQKKLDGYCTLRQSKMDKAQAYRDEANRLMELARLEENGADRLKARLHEHVEAYHGGRVDTTYYKIRVVKNGGKSPLRWQNDLIQAQAGQYRDQYPDLVQVSYSWDNNAVRSMLEEEGDLPFVRIGERGTHVRIR